MTRHKFDSGSFLFKCRLICTGFCHNTGAPSWVYRTMSTFTAVVSPPSVRVPRVSRHPARHIATVKASSESAPRRRVVERVRDRILVSGSAALAASLVMGMGLHAPSAHAFVPIRGCGDPGSPYDTGVEALDPNGSDGITTGCTKLYQPGRAAELRAVAAAKQAAGTTPDASESKRDGDGDAPSGR